MSLSSAVPTSSLRLPRHPADPVVAAVDPVVAAVDPVVAAVDALLPPRGALSAKFRGRPPPAVTAGAPPRGYGSPGKRGRSASPRQGGARTPSPLSRRLAPAVTRKVDCHICESASDPQLGLVLNGLTLSQLITIAAEPGEDPSSSPSGLPSPPEPRPPHFEGAVSTGASYCPGADGCPEEVDEDEDPEGEILRIWAVPLFGADGLVPLPGGRRGTYRKWYTEAVEWMRARDALRAEQGRLLLERRGETIAAVAAEWRQTLLYGPEGAPGTGGAPPSACRAPRRPGPGPRRGAGAPAPAAAE
jgi:hypothetical protein